MRRWLLLILGLCLVLAAAIVILKQGEPPPKTVEEIDDASRHMLHEIIDQAEREEQSKR